MNERWLQRLVVELMERIAVDGHQMDLPVEWAGVEVQTLQGAGVLTSNRGVVLRFEDGSEFQVTLVQSRPGHPGVMDAASAEDTDDEDDDGTWAAAARANGIRR